METLKITRFAGDPFRWADYEIKNIKRDGSGQLIQVDVYAMLWTFGSSIDTIYEIDADGNTSWATDSWTIEEEVGVKTTFHKTYSSDTSNIKGIEVHNLSDNLTATLYFNFTVVNSNNKTTYLTKTSATAILKGNILNSLNTYDYNNAPSVAAVRNYLDSGSFVHQSDIENIVSQAVSNALLTAHPIGSIEVNVSGINPGTYLGGTWEAFGSGQTLVGVNTSDTNFDTVEETGGSKTHSHNYGLKVGGYYVDTVLAESAADGVFTWDSSNKRTIMTLRNSIGSETVNVNGGNASSSKSASMAHYQAIANTSYTSNLQPYITVYFWKRIS